LTTRYSKFTRSIYLIGDIVLINISFLLSYFWKSHDIEATHEDFYFILALYFNLTWIVSAFFLRIYDIGRVEQNRNIVLNLFKILLLHVLLTSAFIVIRKGFYYSREHLLVTYILVTLLIIAWRLACIYFFRYYRRTGYNYRNIIIVGYDDIARNLRRFFKVNPQYGYRFQGFFDDHAKGPEVRGKLEDIKAFSLLYDIDEIYCSFSKVDNRYVNELINFAENNMIRVKIIPDFRGIDFKKINIDFYGHFPVLTFRDIPLDDALNRVTKRTFDIIFSLVILIFIASWLFPVIALLIKIDSPGPIFFKQKRSGRSNEDFWCWKFRTMRVNNESNLQQAIRGDARITKVGAILRRTSLDELPQFFNVLLGNMSVVGPRPHMLAHTEEYSKIIDRYMVRQTVKPGVTGLAQAKGYRGETINPQLMKNRVRVDTFYIENWSFLLDLKIIYMTISSLVKGDRNAF
jgi:putative colanic acid biosysnthesis UDP-glucose lipid carrier transferase